MSKENRKEFLERESKNPQNEILDWGKATELTRYISDCTYSKLSIIAYCVNDKLIKIENSANKD